jgi:FemAB-related protein (PEP-CTERM system-associated)
MGPDGPHLLERNPVIRVRPMASDDRARWDAFVAACPEATFFHRAGWREVLERAFGHRTHYLLAERGGEIVGVLPLTEIRSRLFGHALISNAFCVYGGIATTDEAARAALDSEARKLARALQVGYLEYRNLRPRHPDWPTQDLYCTFRKPLEPDVEANLKAVPRKQRAMVRKGMKNGLKAEFDADVDRFYALFADNVHRHGTPVLPRHYFVLLKEVFGADCDVLTVTHQGRAVSSVLTFWFRDEVLPYYAGDVPAARELAANDFKYWELMRHACERGCRVFDYGRSKRGTGQFDFKKNWGFTPQPLYYEYDLVRLSHIPQHNPANPKYRLFIALWKRLPRAVVNTLGPHLVKSLG